MKPAKDVDQSALGDEIAFWISNSQYNPLSFGAFLTL